MARATRRSSATGRELVETAAAVAAGALVVDAGRRTTDLRAELAARDGIGPWTADYVAMRVIGDPDVLLDGDLAVRRGAEVLGIPSTSRELVEHAQRWRPFRSYAAPAPVACRFPIKHVTTARPTAQPDLQQPEPPKAA